MNLHRYSDQIKTTTVFLSLWDKYCVWTEMLLLRWLYMKGHSPECVHASCIELDLLGYLDEFGNEAQFTALLQDFWNYLCVCLEKEIRTKHCDSEQTRVHRQAMIHECVVLVLCFVFVTSLLNWCQVLNCLRLSETLSGSCYDAQWCSSTILFLPVRLWLLTFKVVFFRLFLFIFL